MSLVAKVSGIVVSLCFNKSLTVSDQYETVESLLELLSSVPLFHEISFVTAIYHDCHHMVVENIYMLEIIAYHQLYPC